MEEMEDVDEVEQLDVDENVRDLGLVGVVVGEIDVEE